VGPVHPDPDLQLGDALQVTGFVRGDQLVPLLRGRLVRLGPAHRGADQDQGTDAFRVPEGEVDGCPAAHRATYEARALDAEAVEQAAQVFVVGVGTIGQGRPAETPSVEAEHAVVLRQRLELPVPHPAVRDPGVEQDHWLARAHGLVVERRALHLREPAPA
jgi:hypothetical protein